MRIAVTYDNGEVFQHFGRTENFKLYEIEDNKIVSSRVISSNGEGHEALAGVLANQGVNVLICGGLGDGAQAALSESGIEVCAGASGEADACVEAYLRGELVNSGVNCDHHHHEEGHGCGGSEGHCGGGCSGCGGGCGQPSIPAGKNTGKTVAVHYRGTLNDGTQFDSSYDRGEPLSFVCGSGMMIRGFDAAVTNMEVGEKIDIHLLPEDAYGEKDPRAIMTFQIAQLQGSEGLTVGQRVYLSDNMGRPVPVTVVEKTDTTITLDANHEMAGKELNFTIELISVQ